jgi:uncharacterized membrane protein
MISKFIFPASKRLLIFFKNFFGKLRIIIFENEATRIGLVVRGLVSMLEVVGSILSFFVNKKIKIKFENVR